MIGRILKWLTIGWLALFLVAIFLDLPAKHGLLSDIVGYMLAIGLIAWTFAFVLYLAVGIARYLNRRQDERKASISANLPRAEGNGSGPLTTTNSPHSTESNQIVALETHYVRLLWKIIKTIFKIFISPFIWFLKFVLWVYKTIFMVAIAVIIVAIKFLFSSSSSTKTDVSTRRETQILKDARMQRMTRIFVTDREYDAVKCFKVNEEYEADLLVFEVKEEYQAIGDDAKWCYVNDEYRASTKVHWVDQEYSADLKIYLVKEEYQAGWRKKEHKLRYKL